MHDMHIPFGEQITMAKGDMACPMEYLCIAQLAVKEVKLVGIKTPSQYLYSALQRLIAYLIYDMYAI